MNLFLILAAIGMSAGVSAGLFGIGGGIIIVPALVHIAGFAPHRATGTSLAVLLPPVGVAAVIEYYRHGAVDLRAALIIAAFLVAGAWLGSIIATKLSGPALAFAFNVFLVLVGVYGAHTAFVRMTGPQPVPGAETGQHPDSAPK